MRKQGQLGMDKGKRRSAGRRLVAILSGAALLLAIGAGSASAAPPTIVSESLSGVTTTSATLEAVVNPEGKATEYHFEYGTSDCLSNPCTALPKGKAITGTSPLPVDKATLQGLSPHTTYHFRILTRHPSDGEEAVGADRTFTTYSPPQVFSSCPNDALRNGQPSGALPDCRAYEQVSPVDKNEGRHLAGADRVLDTGAAAVAKLQGADLDVFLVGDEGRVAVARPAVEDLGALANLALAVGRALPSRRRAGL